MIIDDLKDFIAECGNIHDSNIIEEFEEELCGDEESDCETETEEDNKAL